MKLYKKTFVLTLIINITLFNFQNYLANDFRNKKDSNHNTELTSKIPNKLLYNIYCNNIENIQDENILLQSQIEKKSRKSPWLAFALAYLCPGLGQVYNGEYTKLAIIYGIALVGAGIGYVGLSNSNFWTSKPIPDYAVALSVSGITIIALDWLYSIIDAPISANRINEENIKVSLSIKSSIINKNQILNFAVGKENKYAVGLSLQFGF
jgi:hypothetical protein